jgi:hypothetical protein
VQDSLFWVNSVQSYIFLVLLIISLSLLLPCSELLYVFPKFSKVWSRCKSEYIVAILLTVFCSIQRLGYKFCAKFLILSKLSTVIHILGSINYQLELITSMQWNTLCISKVLKNKYIFIDTLQRKFNKGEVCYISFLCCTWAPCFPA